MTPERGTPANAQTETIVRMLSMKVSEKESLISSASSQRN
jgi:hypothetical protein